MRVCLCTRLCSLHTDHPKIRASSCTRILRGRWCQVICFWILILSVYTDFVNSVFKEFQRVSPNNFLTRCKGCLLKGKKPKNMYEFVVILQWRQKEQWMRQPFNYSLFYRLLPGILWWLWQRNHGKTTYDPVDLYSRSLILLLHFYTTQYSTVMQIFSWYDKKKEKERKNLLQ